MTWADSLDWTNRNFYSNEVPGHFPEPVHFETQTVSSVIDSLNGDAILDGAILRSMQMDEAIRLQYEEMFPSNPPKPEGSVVPFPDGEPKNGFIHQRIKNRFKDYEHYYFDSNDHFRNVDSLDPNARRAGESIDDWMKRLITKKEK